YHLSTRSDGPTLSIRADAWSESWSVQWLIDATGRNAEFARRAGLRRINDDRLVALWAIALPSAETAFDPYTTIEPADEGWFYTVRIPDRRRVIAFLTDGDLPVVRCARDRRRWMN